MIFKSGRQKNEIIDRFGRFDKILTVGRPFNIFKPGRFDANFTYK